MTTCHTPQTLSVTKTNTTQKPNPPKSQALGLDMEGVLTYINFLSQREEALKDGTTPTPCFLATPKYLCSLKWSNKSGHLFRLWYNNPNEVRHEARTTNVYGRV